MGDAASPILKLVLTENRSPILQTCLRLCRQGWQAKFFVNPVRRHLCHRKGQSLPAPKFTANGSITYRYELGDYYLTTSADYSLRSTYHSLFGQLYDVAGYTLRIS